MLLVFCRLSRGVGIRTELGWGYFVEIALVLELGVFVLEGDFLDGFDPDVAVETTVVEALDV